MDRFVPRDDADQDGDGPGVMASEARPSTRLWVTMDRFAPRDDADQDVDGPGVMASEARPSMLAVQDLPY